MSSIGPRDAASTTGVHSVDSEPAASSSADSGAGTSTALPDRSRGGGGGRMAVLASLSATAPVAAGPVGDLVQEVLSGQRKLDVSTATKLIKESVSDKAIDLEQELAPLKALFQGELEKSGRKIKGDLQPGVQFTEAGRLMMQSFVYNAGKVHAKHGESKNAEVRGLRDLAVENASQLAGRERLGELMDLYKDTRVRPHDSGGYIPYTHEHDSNHDIETKYLGAMRKFDRHLTSAATRFFTGSAVGRLFDKSADWIEDDPLKKVREYLEGNYERIR